MKMSRFSATSSWNWSTFCGHGEDIQSWSGNDFGHCFEQVAILAPAHALLAVISAYHLGHCRTTLRGTTLYVNWTWFLVLRQLAVVLLFFNPVFQIIFTVIVEHTQPSIADGVLVGISCLSWLLHSFYVWNLRYLHSSSLRGPLSALVSFLIVVAACAVHVHTVILRHISQSAHRSATEEYITYISAALCLVYLISVIPNRQRIYHTNLSFRINESERESEPLTSEIIRSYSSVDATSESVATVAEQDVSCLSWLTFQWVQKLMSRGARMKISSVEDLYLLPKRLNTHRVDRAFEKVLQSLCVICEPKHKATTHDLTESMRNYADLSQTGALSSSSGDIINHVPASSQQSNSYSNPVTKENTDSEYSSTKPAPNNNKLTDDSRECVSLVKALNKAFGFEYFSLGILKFLADSLGFAGPILLNYLVSFIESQAEETYKGYLFAGGLFLSSLLSTICSTQFDYNVQVVAYKVRCALITTIYRKSLTVNSVEQARFTSGEIVNFMSTDTDRILNFCPSFHAFWSLPFQVKPTLLSYDLYAFTFPLSIQEILMQI